MSPPTLLGLVQSLHHRAVVCWFATAALMALLGHSADARADLAQDVVGKWKLISHLSTMDGQTFDSQAALLQQRPCAAKLTYDVNRDGSYRVDASDSNCDEKYKRIQEKLYARTQWRLEGNRLTTSATNFAVGQTYTVSVSGKRMTWVGTDGQGTLVFQK